MLPVLISSVLSAFAPSAVQTPEASTERVRGWVLSDLDAYEAGDVPRLYVQFENVSSTLVQGRHANAEEMGIFPCDLLWVFRDGTQLAYARPNETHPRPKWRTAIAPGGTLTLEVALDHVCVLPADTTGRYRVRLIADYYPDHVAARRVDFPGWVGGGVIEFDVHAADAARPPAGAPAAELLRRADWKSLLADRPGAATLDELASLARSQSTAPGLRARAVRVLARHRTEADAPELWTELFTAREPVVALTAITEFPGTPPERLVPALVGALEHRDVGVARAAAKKLATATLPDETRARVAAIAATSEDELVREFGLR